MSEPNWFERLVAALIGVVMQVVRGILMAPVIALRRALMPPRVARAPVEEIRPLRHRVLRPGQPPEAAVWEGDDAPDARHWALRWGGEVVGVVTVLAAPAPGGEPFAWQLRGMAVAPEVQGRGLGATLLEAVHTEVAEPMWCNARTTAQAFYARHGWEAVGEPFDKPGIGPHVRMFWTPSQLPVPT